MTDWQPIETASDKAKDGREVLLAFPYENATINPGPPNWLYSVGRYYEGRWVFEDDHRYSLTSNQPTLWKLIDPPA